MLVQRDPILKSFLDQYPANRRLNSLQSLVFHEIFEKEVEKLKLKYRKAL